MNVQWLFIGGCLLLLGCAVEEPESLTKHIWGETVQGDHSSKVPCSEPTHLVAEGFRNTAERLEDTEQKNRLIQQAEALVAAENYVRQVFKFVAERNPQTFHGTLAADHFCVRVFHAPDVNMAAPVANLNQITLFPGTFRYFDSDATVAALLARTLAFVTLEISDLDDWRQVKEADDVGFEIYVRAGFKPEHYLETFRPTHVNNPLQDVSMCLNESIQSQEPSELTNGVYPTECWRMRNIALTEAVTHQAEIDQLDLQGEGLDSDRLNILIKNSRLEEIKFLIMKNFLSDVKDLSSKGMSVKSIDSVKKGRSIPDVL